MMADGRAAGAVWSQRPESHAERSLEQGPLTSEHSHLYGRLRRAGPGCRRAHEDHDGRKGANAPASPVQADFDRSRAAWQVGDENIDAGTAADESAGLVRLRR